MRLGARASGARPGAPDALPARPPACALPLLPLQVVVLSQVLAADVNVGYEEICNTQVGAAGRGWPCCVGTCLAENAARLGVLG